MPKLRVIKNDAIIKVEIGTGFVQKLQQLYFYTVGNLKKEELERYQKLVSENSSDLANKQFDEDWMTHLTTLGILLAEITNSAEKQGLTYEKDDSEINFNL